MWLPWFPSSGWENQHLSRGKKRWIFPSARHESKGESRVTSPLILNLSTTWGEWSAAHPARFIPGKSSPSSTEQASGWDPVPDWTLWWTEHSLVSAGWWATIPWLSSPWRSRYTDYVYWLKMTQKFVTWHTTDIGSYKKDCEMLVLQDLNCVTEHLSSSDW